MAMVIGEMDPLKRGIMQRPVLQIDMRYCVKNVLSWAQIVVIFAG